MIKARAPQHDGGLDSLGVDLTPMIDVLFMLLVFLVLTANTAQFAVDLALPEADDAAEVTASGADGIALRLPSGGRSWAVNGEETADWAAARAELRDAIDARPDAAITILGSKDAALDHAVKALTFLGAVPNGGVEVIVDQE